MTDCPTPNLEGQGLQFIWSSPARLKPPGTKVPTCIASMVIKAHKLPHQVKTQQISEIELGEAARPSNYRKPEPRVQALPWRFPLNSCRNCNAELWTVPKLVRLLPVGINYFHYCYKPWNISLNTFFNDLLILISLCAIHTAISNGRNFSIFWHDLNHRCWEQFCNLLSSSLPPHALQMISTL